MADRKDAEPDAKCAAVQALDTPRHENTAVVTGHRSSKMCISTYYTCRKEFILGTLCGQVLNSFQSSKTRTKKTRTKRATP